ncbi:MAG TPA: guanine deaminase, partial [Casimicrobiaceae bacterium]|nr:guanine deaminase [Casimicrobiaceae bacterium]
MIARAPAEVATPLALRGAALSFVDNPFAVAADRAVHYERDALLLFEQGRIAAFGPAASLLPSLPAQVPVVRHDNALMLPGFIDAHVHYAQLPVIGAFGRTLLDWLEHHTFPIEQRYDDPAFARLT